jgi:hypothetical protein
MSLRQTVEVAMSKVLDRVVVVYTFGKLVVLTVFYWRQVRAELHGPELDARG